MAALLQADGMWTWFNTPVIDGDGTDLYIGRFSDQQRPIVSKYNGSDLVSTHPGGFIGNQYELDDHDNCAIKKLASGKILACWSFHNGDSYSCTSTNANDIRAWNSIITVQTANDDAYAQVCQATYNSTVYWFHRRTVLGDERPQYFRTSTDDGATWSSSTKMFDVPGERPYFRWFQTSGTRFDFVCTDGQPNEAVNSLYHGYMTINASTGVRAYYKSDGTLIGDDTDLPLGTADLTQVYDGTTSEAWIWDLRYIDGQPTVAFAVFPSHGTTAHEYWRGRFNGSTWSTEKICDAGTTATADYLYAAEANYSGGICLDPVDEDIVYASLEYGSGNFRVETWTKSGSWSKTADLSGNTSNVNARPVAATLDGTTNIFWWSGTYTSYTSWDTDIYVHPSPSWRTAKAETPTLSATYTRPGSQLFLPLQESSGAAVDLLGNYTPTQQGTVTRTSEAFGYYASGFSASNYFEIDAVAAAWNSASYPKWIAVQITNSDATTGGQHILSFGRSSANQPIQGIVLNLTNAGDLSYYMRNDANSNISITATSQPINDGNKHVIMVVSRSASVHRLYLDGAQVGTSSTSLGTITLDRGAVGALRRATVASPYLGRLHAAAVGWGIEPFPQWLYDDWSTGRFSGAGPAASTSGLLLANAAYFGGRL